MSKQLRPKALWLAGMMGFGAVMAMAGVAAQADDVKLIWSNLEKRPSIGEPVDSFQMTSDAFAAAHPGVTVEDTYGTGWVAQLLAGDGPDVIGDCCTRFHAAGMRGSFVDLTPYFGTTLPDYMQQQLFWPPQWSAFTDASGHQFALPLYLGTIGMYANTDLFDAAGVAVPSADLAANHQDWNAFEAICKKLTRMDANGKVTQYGFSKATWGDRFGYWLQAAGAQYYVDGDPYRSALASPEAVEGLSYLQRLKNQDQCMSFDVNNFYNGRSGIMEEGSWKLGNVVGATAGKPKVPFGVQVFPMPIGPSGQRFTLATIDGLAVNRNTKHLQDALALLAFAAGKQAEEWRAKYNGLQPARKDVVPEYLNLMDAMNVQAFKVQDHVFTDAGPYAYPQALYADQDTADSLLAAARDKIFNQNAPVKGTWYSAVQALNAHFAELKQASGGESGPYHPKPEPLTWANASWNGLDVATALHGASTPDGDRLSIKGDGSDLWGTADGMRYVYQKVSGDFTATVTLASAPTTDGWGKTGIMVRKDLSPGSANFIVMGTNTHGLRIQWRPTSDEATKATAGPSWKNGTPIHLKLVRKGSSLNGYFSTDGANWTKIGDSTPVDFGQEVYLGLAVTSHSVGHLGEAMFSGWTLTQP